MRIIEDIIIPVLLNMGAGYLYEKVKKPVLDTAYERALQRWSVNSSIREEMAKHQLMHLTQLAEYITSPETLKNKEIAKLLVFWEEELRKDEEAYQYMHEILERETLAVVRKNQAVLVRSGEIIQELKEGQLKLMEEVRALKNSLVVEQVEEMLFTEVERYIGRTVYTPVIVDEGTSGEWLYAPQVLQQPLVRFLTGTTEGLQNTDKFILYSSAQSGKTTELRHTAWELKNSGFYQVYFYEIKDYSSRFPLSSFLEYKQVEGKTTVLLVDGIDEVRESDRLYLLKELEAFAKGHPSLKMLLSCRRNFQQGAALESFLPLYLNELNWEDACEYIRCYASRPLALIHEIERLELYRFTTIPFYLNTVIAYYEEKRRLPHRRGELYQYWIHKSFEVENGKLIDETMPESTEGVLLLSKVAILMQLTEKNAFSEKEMLEIFGGDRQKIFMCRRFAVFTRDTERNYSFEHNAFREYLVACFLKGLELEEIKNLVCYTGESKVKPLWYNTVVLFLSQLSGKDDLFSKVIDWLSRNDREMLLYVDPEWISEEIRNRIFREIVLHYKGLGIPYSDGSREFSILMNFGYSVDSVRFLIDEIKTENDSDDYLNNLMSLLQFVNYEELDIREPQLLRELEDMLFEVIGKFREEEHSYFLFVPLQHKWFCNSRHIRRLYEIIKNSRNPATIGMFIELLLSIEEIDEYVPYILEKEKYIHSYNDRGVNYAIPRNEIYAVLAKIRTFESLRAVLKFIPHDQWGEEEEKLPMKKAVLSVAANICHEHREVCEDVTEAYLEECVRLYDFRDSYKKDSFFVYRDFFRQLPFRQTYLEFYTENLKRTFLYETAEDGKREESAYVLALFLDEKQIDRIFEELTPDSERDYCFSSCLRTTFDEKLEKYVADKIRQHFPKFERALPDYKAREQRDFDVLCDYGSFRGEVLKLIREKAPKGWKDLHPVPLMPGTGRISLYIARFFALHSKDKKYDLLRVDDCINSPEKYEAFLLEKVVEKLTRSNFSVVFSPFQEKLLAELAVKYIDEMLRSRKWNHLYRSALSYILIKGITLPADKLLDLLPYAAYKVSVSGTETNPEYCLFHHIRVQVEEYRFQKAVLQLLDSAELSDERLLVLVADFVTDNCIYEGYPLLVREMVRSQEINRQVHLMFCLLKTEEGKERIKRVYELLAERAQIIFLQKIAKQEEEAEWIKSVLLPVYKGYEERNRLSALYILLYWGDPGALEYCADWLERDPYLFANNSVPALRYKDIAVLDRLAGMLEMTLKLKIPHDRVQAGVLYSMQQIAIQSKANLNKVIKKLKGLIDLYPEYRYLNHYVRTFEEKYYEANYPGITLKEALLKYRMEV